MREEPILSTSPSQLINLTIFLKLALFFWLFIPLFIMLYKWLVIKNTKYELTTERLKTRTGILNKITNELELYRIKDYSLEQPFFLRLFKLSNIKLITSDKTNPMVNILAIKNGENTLEKIRFYTEKLRKYKRVKELDLQ